MLDTIKDSAKDLFANVNSRLTNPFLGTLIFVWIVRNFEFVFTLFNFDDDCSREEKIKIIQDYFKGYNVWEQGLKNVGITGMIIFFTFLLLLIFRILTNCYLGVLNFVNRWMAKSKMIERINYDKLYKLYKDIKSEKENLEKEALDYKKNITEIETKFVKITNNYEALLNNYDNLQLEKDIKDSEVTTLKNSSSNYIRLNELLNNKIDFIEFQLLLLFDKNYPHKLYSYDINIFIQANITNKTEKFTAKEREELEGIIKTLFDARLLLYIFLIKKFNVKYDNINSQKPKFTLSDQKYYELFNYGVVISKIVQNGVGRPNYHRFEYLELTEKGNKLYDLCENYFTNTFQIESELAKILEKI